MNQLYSKYEKQKMMFLLFFFRISLDYMYMHIIRTEYVNITLMALGYQRGAFTFYTDPRRIVVSFILSAAFIIFVVSKIVRNDKPHEMISLGLLATSVLPNHVMFAYSKIEWRFIILHTLFWAWLFMLTYWVTKKMKDSPRHSCNICGITKQNAKIAFWTIVTIFIVGSVILSYRYYGGFHIDIRLDNENVYASRTAARGSFSTLTNYFRNNAMLVVIPLIIVAFLKKKKYVFCLVSVITLLLLFSVDSVKLVLFVTIVSMVVAIVMRTKISKLISYGFVIINFFVIVSYELTGKLLLVEYLIKRIYFIPAINGSLYYECVNNFGNQLFFSTLLRHYGFVSDYAYSDVSLPFMIGRFYYGSVNISANTGGFGSAYAYGIIALFFIPVVYAFMFKLLDAVTVGMNSCFYISFVIIMVYSMVNTSITSILTVYGYIVGIVLLGIMNKTDIFVDLSSNKVYRGDNRRLQIGGFISK